MVQIPVQEEPTLAAMKQAVMNKPDIDRDYLGASAIGDECARKLWYSMRIKQGPSENIYAIEDGHRTEELIAERLRMVDGITLWTHDENGNQFSFEDGDFRGHVDGVIVGLIQAPKTPHVWECKCTSTFKDFVKAKQKYGEKRALEKWNHLYYVQAQIYMHYLKLNRHYMTVASPGGRDIDSCRTEYQRDVALKYIDRAKKILSVDVAPERGYKDKTFYKCKWCPFSEECWK